MKIELLSQAQSYAYRVPEIRLMLSLSFVAKKQSF